MGLLSQFSFQAHLLSPHRSGGRFPITPASLQSPSLAAASFLHQHPLPSPSGTGGIPNSLFKTSSKFSSLVTPSSSPLGRAGLVVHTQTLPHAVMVIFMKILKMCHRHSLCPSLSAPRVCTTIPELRKSVWNK